MLRKISQTFMGLQGIASQPTMDPTATATTLLAADVAAADSAAAGGSKGGPAASVKRAIDAMAARTDALKAENARLKATIAELKKKSTRPRLVKTKDDAAPAPASA